MEQTEFLQATHERFAELLAENPGDAEHWSDAAKLRLLALYLNLLDADREVYDRTGVQDDLNRIADRIDELGAAW